MKSTKMMLRGKLGGAEAWFKVLTTSGQSQAAVMTLGAGQATGAAAEAHAESEQTLLLVSGELEGEVAGEEIALGAGEFVVIPPGTKHRFRNPGKEPAVTFNVYCPPEYPRDEQG